MKKLFSFVLALLLASSSAATITAVDRDAESSLTAEASLTHEALDRVLGDINKDGLVDITDAMALFQHSMVPDIYPVDYPGVLDMEEDGVVDINDAVRLFRYSMLPDQFPISWGEESAYPITHLSINNIDISEYVIATNAEAGGVMTYAATELQKYIELSTGVRLPIDYDGVENGTKRILIDETRVTDDSVLQVFNDEDGLVLSGTAKRSALYAVYNFLEECLDWRFFAEDAEVCYESFSINLAAIDYTFEHTFKIRDIFDTGYFNEELSVKRYQNGDGKRRLMYNDNPASVKYGGSETRCPNGIHTFWMLAGHASEGNQPCTNDETVRQTMLKNLRAFLSANPDVMTVHVSQNDNERYCKCYDCLVDLALYKQPSGAVIELVNWLAEELEDEYPDVKIITFAYRYTLNAPENIVCHPNVMIEFALVDICQQHALTDTECMVTESIYRNNQDVLPEIEKWKEICDQFYLWDYGTNFKYYYIAVPTFDVLRQNYQYLMEIGAWGYVYQCNSQSPSTEFAVLRDYLLCKITEDPDMTEEEYNKHIDEFLECYYGPGWEGIRAYLDLIHKISNEYGECFGVYSSPEKIYGPYAFAPYSDQLVEWFNTALENAETETQKIHIRKLRLSCEFLRIGAIHYDVTTSGTALQKRALRAASTTLYNDLQEFGCIYFCENQDVKFPVSQDIGKNPRTWWEDGVYSWILPTYVEKNS